jgi:hypothetical protein
MNVFKNIVRFLSRRIALVSTLYPVFITRNVEDCYVFVRVSDLSAATNKLKLSAYPKLACISNLVAIFGSSRVIVIADCVSSDLRQSIDDLDVQIIACDNRSGGKTFLQAVDTALSLPKDVAVYLVEDDYIHCTNALTLILEGINMGFDYVSLYDHPDKYEGHTVVNPSVRGGELTRLLISSSTHWKLTDSTTMTFATTVSTLIEDQAVIRRFCQGRQPQDYDMFLQLRCNGRTVASSVPGASTHTEIDHLSPLVDWDNGVL